MLKRLAFVISMLVVGVPLIVIGATILALPVIVIVGIILVLGALGASAIFAFIALIKAISGPDTGFRPNNLTGSTKTALRDARHYAKHIKKTVQECDPGPVRSRLERSVQPVDDWLDNLTQLEKSLGKLYAQRNLSREMQRTKFEIDQLRKQVLTATSVKEVDSLRALMKSKKKHYAALENLRSFQNQAELKIRRIASDLGATHADILLIATRGDFSESRFNRLDENLQENMAGLRDILTAMDEMGYMSNAAG